jgi:hypothetical protein
MWTTTTQDPQYYNNNISLQMNSSSSYEDFLASLPTSVQYRIIVPIFIVACLVTFLMNLFIILAYPLIRKLSRVSFVFIRT